MTGTGYCDTENLINERFPDVVSDDGKEAIALLVESASRFIDSYLGKRAGHFLPSPQIGTARNYRGDGGKILRIHQHIPGTVSITNLNIEDWYENKEDNFFLYRGESANYPNLQPGYVFELNFDTYDRDVPVWIDNRLYVVTARWGYEEVPADIQEACMQIVYRCWKSQAGTLGEITPNGYVTEKDMSRFAKTTLESYKAKDVF